MTEPRRLSGIKVKILRDRLTAIEQEISDDETDEDITDMQLHYGTEGMKVDRFNPFQKLRQPPAKPASDKAAEPPPSAAGPGERETVGLQLVEEDIDEAMAELESGESDKSGTGDGKKGKKKRRRKKKQPKTESSKQFSNSGEDEDDEIPPPYTGMFDDGVRRVDYILVVADDNAKEVEHIKVTFMMSLLKLGLELEIVPGVMKKHRHLLFIKVHAPASVLLEFAEAFAVKKYFKDAHLSFMKSGKWCVDYLLKYRHEREWIRLVRKNYIKPLKYSNFERSYVVHMLLYHQPFGDQYMNYYGIHRLLSKNIILDAYALHDGPYFFLVNQNFAAITARQILFYNWVGIQNIFTYQPLNLIYEYFGSRIAFYFALYEYYNKFLALLSLITLVIVAVMGDFLIYFKWDYLKKGILDSIPITEELVKTLCPQRFYDFYEYYTLDDVRTNYAIDRYYTSAVWALFGPLVVCLWAIFFNRMWKRKEKYWIWIWELGHRPKYPIMRPEYSVNRRSAGRHKDTGAWKTSENCVVRGFRSVVVSFFGAVWMMIMLSLLYSFFRAHIIIYKKYASDKEKGILRGSRYRHYVVLGAAASYATFALCICEWILKHINYYLTRFENHRTHVGFVRSLTIKYFVLSMCYTFPVLFYTAYFKGLFFTTPEKNLKPKFNITFPNNIIKPQQVQLPGEIGNITHFTCGLFGCLSETTLVYLILIIVRLIVVPSLAFIWRSKTDYTQGKKVVTSVPCWEREFRLRPITEQHMVDRYNAIALQFALVTLFSNLFWPVPIIALVINMWDIRHRARRYLLCSRRAMLFHFEGVGVWNSCLFAVVIMLPLVHVLTYTRLHQRLEISSLPIYNSVIKHSVDISKFPKTEHPGKPNTTEENCIFRGNYDIKMDNQTKMPWPFEWLNETDSKTKLMPRMDMYVTYTYGILTILCAYSFYVVMALVGIYLPSESTMVHENMCMERALKRIHFHKIKYEEVRKQQIKEELAKEKEEERLKRYAELNKQGDQKSEETGQNKGESDRKEQGRQSQGDVIQGKDKVGLNKGEGEQSKKESEHKKKIGEYSRAEDKPGKEIGGVTKGEGEQSKGSEQKKKAEEHTSGKNEEGKEIEGLNKGEDEQSKVESEQKKKIAESSRGDDEQGKEIGGQSKGESEHKK